MTQNPPKKIFKYCTLEQALAYQNPNVLYKFMENFNVTFDEAELLFTEVKRYLWFGVNIAKWQKREIPLPPPFNALDEMWHTFILFTEEYCDYCYSLYGQYLHHKPYTKEEKDQKHQAYLNDHTAYYEQKKTDLKNLYTAIYETLGEDILMKWRVEYPPRFMLHLIRKERNTK